MILYPTVWILRRHVGLLLQESLKPLVLQNKLFCQRGLTIVMRIKCINYQYCILRSHLITSPCRFRFYTEMTTSSASATTFQFQYASATLSWVRLTPWSLKPFLNYLISNTFCLLFANNGLVVANNYLISIEAVFSLTKKHLSNMYLLCYIFIGYIF